MKRGREVPAPLQFASTNVSETRNDGLVSQFRLTLRSKHQDCRLAEVEFESTRRSEIFRRVVLRRVEEISKPIWLRDITPVGIRNDARQLGVRSPGTTFAVARRMETEVAVLVLYRVQ